MINPMSQHYEDRPAERQKMTFKTYREFAVKRGGQSSLPEGVYARPKVYNNFALSLSDQCPWHLILRTDKEEKEYFGPLIMQEMECAELLKDSTPFVKLYSRASKYKRLPSVAVEEALANAVIHFDSSLERDIIIDFRDDGLTIRSPGGFIEKDNFDVIVSTCPRNPKTALLMKSLGLVRLEGTGLELIRGCYLTTGLMPVITSDADSFCIQLPSLDNADRTIPEETETVISYLRSYGSGNIWSMSRILKIRINLLERIFNNLESEGRIFTMGLEKDRRAFYNRSYTMDENYTIVHRPDIRSSAGMSDRICC